MRTLFHSLLLPAMLGMVTLSLPASEGSKERDHLNGGYYLLHKLCDDEAKLPLLLDVKDAPKELGAFAIKVSKTAKENLATLEKMQEHDKSMDFDKNPLPKIEQDVRDSIKEAKQHQLLFGTKGPEFSRALLVAQIEASSYGENLCKVLAQQETKAGRAKPLDRLASEWHALHEQAFALLRNY